MTTVEAAAPDGREDERRRLLAEEALAAALAPELESRSLLRAALVHRSYCAEHDGETPNERLEFLGDAVLGLVVAEHLYRAHSGRAEGDLARMRSAVVSSAALAPVARELGLGAALFLGRGEANSGGRDKDSILADGLEAVIGAAFLDGGLGRAASLVLRLVGALLDEQGRRGELGDAKNRLQELAARRGLSAPIYETEGWGPDHERHFRARVQVGTVVATGDGVTKKAAERRAAEDAISGLVAGGSDA